MEEKKQDRDNHEESYYKKLTLPNVLTVFRMIASIGLCGYIATMGIASPLLVTLATIGIGATDAMDGFLARNCGMSSQLGSILDPIADKIFNWGLGITLMATGIMPLWPLLIAVRDVSVFSVSSYHFKKNGKELLPTIPAKLKMLFQSAGVVSTLAFGFGSTGLSLIAPICMGAAIATVVPEIFCIKKKYFSNSKEEPKQEEANSAGIKTTTEEENTSIQKSKSISYRPTLENQNQMSYDYEESVQTLNYFPKVKKKTIFDGSIFHRKNNNRQDTGK